MELGHCGITSNRLCREGAVTGMNRELLRGKKQCSKLESRVVPGRLATVEEIAACAAFLDSDKAACVNGAELVHDGDVSINLLWWR